MMNEEHKLLIEESYQSEKHEESKRDLLGAALFEEEFPRRNISLQ